MNNFENVVPKVIVSAIALGVMFYLLIIFAATG